MGGIHRRQPRLVRSRRRFLLTTPPFSTTARYYDSFDGRNVSGSLGTSSDGNDWANDDAAHSNTTAAVRDGAATYVFTAGGGYSNTDCYLNHGTLLDQRVRMRVRSTTLDVGGAVFARYRDPLDAAYSKGVQFSIQTDGSVDIISSGKRNDSWNWGASWTYEALAPGTMTTSDALWVEVTLTGAQPYTMEARVWKDGTSRPSSAQLTESASDADFEQAGKSGFWVGNGAANTPTIYVDRFETFDFPVTGTASVSPAPASLSATGKVYNGHAGRVMALLPTAYWRFTETNGTTAVDEVGLQNGEYINAPTLNVGGSSPDDAAITLNGTDEYVSVPYNSAWSVGTQDFSAAAIVNLPVWPSSDTYGHDFIIGRGNGYGAGDWALIFNVYATNRVSFTLAGVDYNFDTGITLAGTGYHTYVISVDRSQYATLYIDGVQRGQADVSAQSATNISNLRTFQIGSTHEPWSWLAATVDEGAYWLGTALSQSEAASISVMTGTASVTAPAASLSATGTSIMPVTGEAAVTAPAASLSATGAEVFTGTSAVTTAPASLSSTGAETFTGTAAVTVAPATLSATGSLVFTGTSAVTTPAASLAATGTEVFTGTSTVTAAPASLSASGSVIFTGTAAVTVSPASLSATGAEVFTGTAAVTTPPASLSAEGWHSIFGTSDLTAPAATLSSEGTTAGVMSGDAAVTAPAASLSATGSLIFTGTSAVTASPASLSASGWAEATGTATLTAAPASLSASGTLIFTGTAALTAAPASLSASGGLTFTGTATLTAAPASLSATGALVFTGTSAVTAAPASFSATGTLVFTGTAAVTAAPASLTADGTVANPVTGTSAVTTAPSTLSATGAEVYEGTSAVTAAPATLTADGTVANPVTGTATLSAPPATLSASGGETFTGTAAVAAAPAQVAASGGEAFSGSAAVTSPAPTLSSSGELVFTGSAALTSASAQVSASGEEGFTGTSAVTASSATLSADAMVFVLIYPDADIDAGGWTTAPLWSKVDEQEPDDVVIEGVTA